MPSPPGKGSDRFFPPSLGALLSRIRSELETGYIFGIPRELFYSPSPDDNFRMIRFGKLLETPVGLAAGPHTQLAGNIISGWLTGARFIELKTVQEIDDIKVSKPCIDMRDEGYNCEWSQELNIDQSFSEYLKAWILIHYLMQELHTGKKSEAGFIFNMSAGYNLAGIKGKKVSDFLNKMCDSSEYKKKMIDEISGSFPGLSCMAIPDKISDNITISTMHGTPPEEIEKIGNYFIGEAGLHTTLKLNPTLLGPRKVRKIINQDLGYDAVIPDSAFQHDIGYPEALELVKNLKDLADKKGVSFGLKLTNTLECLNPGDIFSGKEKMAYLSGRALHPVSVNIALMFRKDLSGDIDISFSAGADAFNIPELIACNLKPVTVTSDILKPGGYGRIRQYLGRISDAISGSGEDSIDKFIRSRSNGQASSPSDAALFNLREYTEKISNSTEYRKTGFRTKNTKTDRVLGLFDCINAPCTDACGTSQDVPGYLYMTSIGKFRDAFEIVSRTNSFPNTTGMVCDHQCQIKCTRSNYDSPVKIREVKRFLAENYGNLKTVRSNQPEPVKKGTGTIAVIGAGPSGLTCARYLSENGFIITMFEKEKETGGMIRKVIPGFRLGSEALKRDIERILDPEIKIRPGSPVDPGELKKIREEFDYVYLSTGAPESIRLEIEGIDSPGVLDPLVFLSEIKSGRKVNLGKRIAVIGGGNTAVDSARTALRLAGEGAEVTILYRRTRKEMPADHAEILSAIEEGIRLIELTAPGRVITGGNGNITGLRCFKTRLSKTDRSGRRYPEKIDGSEYEMPFDTIIPAVGQRKDPALFDIGTLKLKKEGRLLRDGNVLVGGDAGPGTATIVNAIGDGKAAAAFIMQGSGMLPVEKNAVTEKAVSAKELRLKKAVRIFGQPLKELPPAQRLRTGPVISAFTESEAVEEAKRCLLCNELCDICVTVCPNRANIPYRSEPFSIRIPVYTKKDNEIKITGTETFEILQTDQVLNITDLCNHCGNCTTFCPGAGKPYLDKPRLALSAESFEYEDNVFFITKENGIKKIIYRQNSEIEVLYRENGVIYYTSSGIKLHFSVGTNDITDIRIDNNTGIIPDFRKVLTMKHLIDSVPDHLTDHI